MSPGLTTPTHTRRQAVVEELLEMAVNHRAPVSPEVRREADLIRHGADALMRGEKVSSPWVKAQARLIRKGADRRRAQRRKE
jgi:hypothetical protein